jgi:ribonucleotide reductase alpha subunit
MTTRTTSTPTSSPPIRNIMCVIKRDGGEETVSFDKVVTRIRKMVDLITQRNTWCKWGQPRAFNVNVFEVAQKVCARIYDRVKTSELDELTAQLCSSLMVEHPDYGVLAAYIAISNHHKKTSPSFSETIHMLYHNKDIHGNPNPLVSDEVFEVTMANKEKLNDYLKYDRDFDLDFFGYKTLEKGYLTRINGVVVERPQHLFMRVAMGIHGTDLKDALETYDAMSQKLFTHATPTLFNSGTRIPQMSSCFLLAMEDDSVAGMYNTLADCAQISKYAGGIGVHIHNIRAKGSRIRGTNGTSNGIIPMLRVYNAAARHIDQAGRRAGSIAVYLEPWHADIMAFLDLKKNHGTEEERARDLFYAMWIPDLFMERVKANGMWSLMCPDECPGLPEAVGDEFKALYDKYEAEGKFRKQVKAQEVWFKILESQIETGTPYMLYKDHVNMKSNQKNLGTIKSSNLCVAPETLIRTDNGDLPIGSLKDKVVRVFNGVDYSEVTVRHTGVNQPLLHIRLRNKHDGSTVSLDCTPYHKFILKGEQATLNNAYRMDASLLTKGVELWDGHVVESVEDLQRNDDTYCFNEPTYHAGVFNGILTGNCSEITEYTDKDETAVCNLASMCLPSYIKHDEATNTRSFDHVGLHRMVKIVTKNLNKIIDNNLYPTDKANISNFKHRPIGVGIQGLADVFALMHLPFDSPEAATLNRDIFETMYHASLEASMEISKKRGEWYAEVQQSDVHERELTPAWKKLRFHPSEIAALSNPAFPVGAYSSFVGSPASQGILQFDMWGVQPSSGRYDWTTLKAHIQQYGLRNSLLLAPMPTASTSQIMGFNECFEPFTSNLYKRKTLAGEFIVVNKYLMEDLMDLNLWDREMKEKVMIGEGSIQHIGEIPADIRDRYKTVWEIKQKVLIDMAADRGVFICQSQSMNLFMEAADFKKMTSMHFYAWEKGLKTGMYYLRTKPRATTQQFTIDPRKSKSNIDRTVHVPVESPRVEPVIEAVAQDEDVEQEAVGCQWKPGCKTCSS